MVYQGLYTLLLDHKKAMTNLCGKGGVSFRSVIKSIASGHWVHSKIGLAVVFIASLSV